MNQAMILQKLRLLGSSLISDAKGGTDVVNYEIRSRTNEEHLIAGIAETVQILQKSLDPVRSIFDKCAKKSSIILAIDASGLFGAVWGEIFTRFAKKSNIIGVIIDGGVRDLIDIRKLDFPIWARYITPRVITGEWATTFTPGFELGTHVSVPIMVGGVLIRPGDYIVADIDGVVVLRPEEITNVLEKAENIKTMEEKMF
ncbi:MAG TPA: RraA family protein [Candidatus Lokiarchaeia archaeon]|nr:RraA family protein [Candidatus Lokiarchaeia archaeon]